jgi:hypothetical protein
MKGFYTLLLVSVFSMPLAFAQAVNDQDIRNRVNQALTNNESFSSSDILVVSINGHVMLAGQVLSDDLKQEASVTAAFASMNIRRLINELEVVDALDTSFVDSDQAILEQIIKVIPELSPATMPVIHNGVVHLMGQVTRDEGSTVANTISRMNGVKNIRISYEYIQ